MVRIAYLLAMLLFVGCSGNPDTNPSNPISATAPNSYPDLPVPSPQGQNVGNGGDFTRGAFEQGRIHAISVLGYTV